MECCLIFDGGYYTASERRIMKKFGGNIDFAAVLGEIESVLDINFTQRLFFQGTSDGEKNTFHKKIESKYPKGPDCSTQIFKKKRLSGKVCFQNYNGDVEIWVEEGVDAAIGTKIIECAYGLNGTDPCDKIVVITGDGDLLRAIECAEKKKSGIITVLADLGDTYSEMLSDYMKKDKVGDIFSLDRILGHSVRNNEYNGNIQQGLAAAAGGVSNTVSYGSYGYNNQHNGNNQQGLAGPAGGGVSSATSYGSYGYNNQHNGNNQQGLAGPVGGGVSSATSYGSYGYGNNQYNGDNQQGLAGPAGGGVSSATSYGSYGYGNNQYNGDNQQGLAGPAGGVFSATSYGSHGYNNPQYNGNNQQGLAGPAGGGVSSATSYGSYGYSNTQYNGNIQQGPAAGGVSSATSYGSYGYNNQYGGYPPWYSAQQPPDGGSVSSNSNNKASYRAKDQYQQRRKSNHTTPRTISSKPDVDIVKVAFDNNPYVLEFKNNAKRLYCHNCHAVAGHLTEHCGAVCTASELICGKGKRLHHISYCFKYLLAKKVTSDEEWKALIEREKLY